MIKKQTNIINNTKHTKQHQEHTKQNKNSNQKDATKCNKPLTQCYYTNLYYITISGVRALFSAICAKTF